MSCEGQRRRPSFNTALASALLVGASWSQVPQPRSPVEQDTLMREIPEMALPYVPAPQRQPPCDGNRHTLIIDIDADGDLDLLYEPNAWRGVRLFLNDGDGRLAEETAQRIPVPLLTPNAWRICAGDIDGDGDLDLVGGTDTGAYAPRYVQGLVYMNDGTAHFSDESAARLPSIQVYPYSRQSCTALGDFDGDGDLDLVFGGNFSPYEDRSIRLLRNDGLGNFSYDPAATPVDRGAIASHSGHLFEVDVDADGDLDLLGNGPGIPVWLNDGSGRFTDARLTHVHPMPAISTLAIAIADFDRDGDPDLVASRAFVGGLPYLYLNDGRGHFYDATATQLDPRGQASAGLRAGDLDGDGDLDFLSTAQTMASNFPGGEFWFENDGQGRFTIDAEHRIFPLVLNGGSYDSGIADFDGDGDLDCVITDSGIAPYGICRTRYYQNTTRQTWGATRAAIGAPWQVAVAARQGEQALLAYGLLTATQMLPGLGRLRLDPSTLLLHPSLLTMGPTHSATATIPIPNLPQLRGMALHAQALVFHADGSARLTNLWSEAAIR